VRESSQAKVCYNNRLQLEAALDQYILEYGESPSSFDDIVGPDKYVQSLPICLNTGIYNANYVDDHFVANCSVHGAGPPQLPGARP
jgi:hypothetical protein